MRSNVLFFLQVSTHSRPKAAGFFVDNKSQLVNVSTHSRPKAAGAAIIFYKISSFSFNSQPPEGGWLVTSSNSTSLTGSKPMRTNFQAAAIQAETWRCWVTREQERRIWLVPLGGMLFKTAMDWRDLPAFQKSTAWFARQRVLTAKSAKRK